MGREDVAFFVGTDTIAAHGSQAHACPVFQNCLRACMCTYEYVCVCVLYVRMRVCHSFPRWSARMHCIYECVCVCVCANFKTLHMLTCVCMCMHVQLSGMLYQHADLCVRMCVRGCILDAGYEYMIMCAFSAYDYACSSSLSLCTHMHIRMHECV